MALAVVAFEEEEEWVGDRMRLRAGGKKSDWLVFGYWKGIFDYLDQNLSLTLTKDHILDQVKRHAAIHRSQWEFFSAVADWASLDPLDSQHLLFAQSKGQIVSLKWMVVE